MFHITFGHQFPTRFVWNYLRVITILWAYAKHTETFIQTNRYLYKHLIASFLPLGMYIFFTSNVCNFSQYFFIFYIYIYIYFLTIFSFHNLRFAPTISSLAMVMTIVINVSLLFLLRATAEVAEAAAVAATLRTHHSLSVNRLAGSYR